MPSRGISHWVPTLNSNSNYGAYEIGEYSYGHPKIISFGEDVRLKIGKFCSVADNAVIFMGGEHHPEFVTTYPFAHFFPFANHFFGTHPKMKGNITIGNDVWIGQEAFILSGVTIGDGAVVGARAVVAKDVKPYSIVVGNPAKHIKFRIRESFIEEMLAISWWDWPLEKIADAMPLMLSDDVEGFVARYRIEGA